MMRSLPLGLALIAAALLLLAEGWRYRVAAGALYVAAAGYVWHLGRGRDAIRERLRLPLLGLLFIGGYFLLTGLYHML